LTFEFEVDLASTVLGRPCGRGIALWEDSEFQQAVDRISRIVLSLRLSGGRREGRNHACRTDHRLADDQDCRAVLYEVLGLQVKTTPVRPEARWHRGLPRTRTVSRSPARGDAARAFSGPRRGRPSISLSTDDAQRDYERLRANGVEFTMPPTRMDYGGTDAVFDDTCGNLINLHQD
jgi:hypothetical protein